MFTTEEATAERIEVYRDALTQEKAAIAQALAQEKAAGNANRVKRLEQRQKANAAELARVRKLKPGEEDAGESNEEAAAE